MPIKFHTTIVLVLSMAFAISCAEKETHSQAPKPKSTQPPKTKATSEAATNETHPEVATFAVPEMDEAKIKGIIGELSNDKGVLEAKPDTAANKLSVTLVPGKTNPKKILASLQTIVPGATLDKIESAGSQHSPKHDCGGCPMRNACQGAH